MISSFLSKVMSFFLRLENHGGVRLLVDLLRIFNHPDNSN